MRTCQSLAQAFSRKSTKGSPHGTPEKRKHASFHNPKKLWYSIMEEIKHTGDPLQVLRAFRKTGNLPKETIVGVLTQLKRLQDWNSIVLVTKWLKQRSWWAFGELDYHFLIAAYAKMGEPEKVKEAMRCMKASGFSPNVASYTSLIEAYGERGLLYEAEGIFNDMREDGPMPTTVTYQTMIKAFVKKGKHDDAERIYFNIKADDVIEPDQKLFNLMIYSYGKCGKIEKAKKLMVEMKALNVSLSVVTYNSLLSCNPSVKDAETVFHQMCYNEEEPDIVSYACRLNAFAKARRGKDAHNFFKRIIAPKISPNCVIYNILLDAYAKCKMVNQAELLLEEMRSKGCKPDVHSFTTLMNTYVNASKMLKAENVLKRMKLEGVEPNIVTYGTLVKGYASKGDVDRMVKKYEEMRHQHIEVSQTLFILMLRAFGKYMGLDRAMSWFKEMNGTGFQPDGRAHKILLELSMMKGRRDEVEEFLDNLT